MPNIPKRENVRKRLKSVSGGLWKRLVWGGLFKLLESGLGVLSGHLSATHATMQGKLLVTANVFLSPALLGVGYIVGLNIAVLVFAGGVIGTAIGVPLNWALNSERILEATGIPAGTPLHVLGPEEWVAVADESWQNCRRIGVGAMLVGGFWSLISLAGPLVEGIRSSLRVYKRSRSDETVSLPRTERDMPFQIVALTVLVASVPLFFAFYWAWGDYHGRGMIAAVMTVMMLLFGFLFSSVAGYMSGLVGSSNNPISGVTVATVVVTAVLLTQLMGRGGVAATLGPIMVIFLAANVCASAAIAGDNMQDLKCGHVLGATPWRQQIFQLVGVVSAAFVIPLILNILDRGHGIGRPLREGASFSPCASGRLDERYIDGNFRRRNRLELHHSRMFVCDCPDNYRPITGEARSRFPFACPGGRYWSLSSSRTVRVDIRRRRTSVYG